MKKQTACVALLLLLAPCILAGEEETRVLSMEIHAGDGQDLLRVRLSQLDSLAAELTAGLEAADIRLVDNQEREMALLGTLRKGRIKWAFKTIQESFLGVRVAAAYRATLADAIRRRLPRPGIRLGVSEPGGSSLLRSFPIAPGEFADLAVQLNYPVNVAPGQSLAEGSVTVTLENRGGEAATQVVLELVLSGDDQIPQRPARESAAFAEDMLLAGGRQTVATLAAGEQATVSFPGPLTIPADIPPGKRYLAVVADPADAIAELGEENNVSSGFIMIAVPAPQSFAVEMPETLLHFTPADYGFEIVCGAVLLSDGKDWKRCRMKPNVYHLQHVSWSGFFWEVDTQTREVFEITGSEFCKKGGNDRLLNIRVEVSGGSLTVPPSRFTLKLAQTQLRFEPGSKVFELLSHGKPIFHKPFWWICRRESHLYQVRYAPWQESFLQVDTAAAEVSLVSGVKFCTADGQGAKLPWAVKVEP